MAHAHDHGEDGRHVHDHSHAGGSHGHHHHVPSSFDRAFAIGVALNLTFVVAEVVFGLRAHSLALTADAGHNLGDELGLLLEGAGSVLCRLGPTPRGTYGLPRGSSRTSTAHDGSLHVAVGGLTCKA